MLKDEENKCPAEQFGLPKEDAWLSEGADEVKAYFIEHKEQFADLSARFIEKRTPALASILPIHELGDGLVRYGLMFLQLGYYVGKLAGAEQANAKKRRVKSDV